MREVLLQIQEVTFGLSGAALKMDRHDLHAH